MYGLKNHKFSVTVAPPVAVEVALIWKDVLSANESLHFNGLTQFANAEREPTEARRFATAGKARAYLEAKAKTFASSATAKCSFDPEWMLTVTAQGGMVQVGNVMEDASIAWSAEGLQHAFGIYFETVKIELAAFREA